MATAKELRSMERDDLEARAAEARANLARLSMKRYARRLDKTSDLKVAKKDLARLLTVLRQKQSSEAGGAD